MTYYEFRYRVEKHSDKYAIRKYKVYYYDDCIKWEDFGLVFDIDFCSLYTLRFDTEEDAYDYILNELE